MKSKTRIQSDDDIIFLEVFKEGDIINLFKEELVKHNYLLQSNNYSNKFDNKVFDFIKYKWWFNDHTKLDIDLIMKYYNSIDHINKIIHEQSRGSKTKIFNLIKIKNIKEDLHSIIMSSMSKILYNSGGRHKRPKKFLVQKAEEKMKLLWMSL